MKLIRRISVGELIAILILLSASAWGQKVDEEKLHPAIPLLDESGANVLQSQKPYSPRTTCGQCHDYESITHSFHIEQGRDETDDDFGKKIGLPQLIGPGYFGGYSCMGGNNPDQLAKKENASADDFSDLGAAGWIQRCEGCHSGGGWMEKDRQGRRYDEVDPATVKAFDGDYFNRGTDANNQPADASVVSQWDWKKSGVVENDCLMCHIDQSRLQIFDKRLLVEDGPDGYDLWRTLRRYKFIDNGFFRYNATAMMEYLNIRHPDGMNKDINLLSVTKKDISIEDGRSGKDVEYELELDKNGMPQLTWNRAAFDEDGKVSIPMTGFPPNDNCMQCHRTSNSRRGFYGFGEEASAVYDEEGMLVDDYKDDVHYGKVFTEANGESREISTCNACHARNYYRESWVNVDLDADHNFLKGNSDMNVADHRDYQPKAKSCMYCHDTGPRPISPSGHKNMAEAHLALWKSGGDLRGYSKDDLESITQTHMDEISCQACHITNKKNRGRDLQILYQYRREEDGKLRMTPYNPRARYFWKDKNSDRVLSKTERNSVFEHVVKEDGTEVGQVKDPDTGEVVLEVSARISHGSLRYGEPETYEGYAALKKIYDKLLARKGVENPDVVMIWTEINRYLMSHNTRPSTEALQCESCHNRKQNGVISSLVAPDSILGSGNVKEVTALPDAKMVEDGLVILDMPYMQVDAEGKVTETVEDILYYTLVNPSMTRLNIEIAPSQRGQARKVTAIKAMNTAGIWNEKHRELVLHELVGDDSFIFRPNYGVAPIRGVSVITRSDFVLDMIMPWTSFRAELSEDAAVAKAAQATTDKGSKLASDIVSLEVINSAGDVISSLLDVDMLVVLPYRGAMNVPEKLQLLTSVDGKVWDNLGAADILAVKPAHDGLAGYVVLRTTEMGYFAIADKKGAVVASCSLPESCGN